ncbi:hypothetical protein HDU93_007065, partial [Gonapodya sp. JEL0774]
NMQSLKESETTSLKFLLTAFCSLDRSSHEQLARHVETAAAACTAVDAAADCAMFSQHNKKAFADAPKFVFESTPLWVDKEGLEQDHESKVVLLNKLAKYRARLVDLGENANAKSKEITGLTTLMDSYRRDPRLGDADLVREQLLDSQRELALVDISRAKIQSQIDVIAAQVGETKDAGPFHKFKQTNFTLPSPCDLCGQSIWGMGKGKTCSECGFNVHHRCELRVSPSCSGVKSSGHGRVGSSSVSRKTSASFGAAVEGVSNRSSVAGDGGEWSPDASTRVSQGLLGVGGRRLETMESSVSMSSTLSRAIYSYTKQTDEEISVTEGDIVEIVEPDLDGWTKISLGGHEGVVPTSYLEPCSSTSTASAASPSTVGSATVAAASSPSSAAAAQAHAQTQNKRASVVHGSLGAIRNSMTDLGSALMLYDYEALNDEEITVKERSPVKIVEPEQDGWVKISFKGKEGLVPATYVGKR